MPTTEFLGKKIDVEKVRKELTRRGEVSEDIGDEERERRRKERLKCLDVVYWTNTYCYTYDPRLQDPYVPFKLYDRQVELLRWFEEREKTQTRGLVEKSKDVGVSWLFCAFMTHRWLFKKGFAGGLGSRKLEYVDNIGDPKSLFEKIRTILRKLPTWLMPTQPLFDWKKDSFECRLINREKGSSLVGEGGIEIGRGGRTSVYGVDEYNYLEHPELADAALRDNTNVLIYLGTPNGMVGIYEKRGEWPTFTFSWKDDPRKNYWEIKKPASEGGIAKSGKGPNAPEGAVYPWYERQLEAHKGQLWIVRQEIDIDYLGSGYPRFDRPFLMEYRKTCPPPERLELPGPTGWSAEVRTWKEPERGRRYVLLSDVAEGISNSQGDPDRSCTHIYDADTWEQVVTYRGRPDTHSYAIDIAVLGEMYNWADAVIERNGVGVAVLSTLSEEIGYPNIWSEAMSQDRSILGVRATRKGNVESEKELEGIIADMQQGFDGFIWNDEHTVDELIHIVVKPNGRAEAEGAWHDDDYTCVRMAAVILPQVSTRKYYAPMKPNAPAVFYGARRRY